MCSTGRLDRRQGLGVEGKHKVIIKSHDRITELIMQNAQEQCLQYHETVINEIKQRYVIFGLRNVVKTITHRCQWYKIKKGQSSIPHQGQLPIERISYNKPPFNCSAIDYFGPMTVTIGRRTEKSWGVLITCLTMRVIHIEFAPSVTPTSAILVLRRFMARCGTRTMTFSDIAMNFTRASIELREAAEKVKEYATARKITWKYIPSGAPHMGGAWERSCVVTPIGEFDAREANGHTWKATQALVDTFWKTRVIEYSPTLLPKRTANTSHHQEPKVDDIILITDSSMPRGL